jgi:hypothetical protein
MGNIKEFAMSAPRVWWEYGNEETLVDLFSALLDQPGTAATRRLKLPWADRCRHSLSMM